MNKKTLFREGGDEYKKDDSEIPTNLNFESNEYMQKNKLFFDALRAEGDKNIALLESGAEYYTLIHFIDMNGKEHVIPSREFKKILGGNDSVDLYDLLSKYQIGIYANLEKALPGKSFAEWNDKFLYDIDKGEEIHWDKAKVYIAQQCLLQLGGEKIVNFSSSNIEEEGEKLITAIRAITKTPCFDLHERHKAGVTAGQLLRDLHAQEGVGLDNEFFESEIVAELTKLFPEGKAILVPRIRMYICHNQGMLYRAVGEDLSNYIRLKFKDSNIDSHLEKTGVEYIDGDSKSEILSFLEGIKKQQLEDLIQLFKTLNPLKSYDVSAPGGDYECTVSIGSDGRITFMLKGENDENHNATDEIDLNDKIIMLKSILNIPFVSEESLT